MLKHCWIALDSSEKHTGHFGHSGLTASITRKRQWRHKMSPKTRWKTSRITSFKNKGNFCTDWCEIAASKAGLISRRVAQVQTVLDRSCFAQKAKMLRFNGPTTVDTCPDVLLDGVVHMVHSPWNTTATNESTLALYPIRPCAESKDRQCHYSTVHELLGHCGSVKPRDSRRIQAPHQPIITIFNNYIKAQLNGAKADVLHLAQAS